MCSDLVNTAHVAVVLCYAISTFKINHCVSSWTSALQIYLVHYFLLIIQGCECFPSASFRNSKFRRKCVVTWKSGESNVCLTGWCYETFCSSAFVIDFLIYVFGSHHSIADVKLLKKHILFWYFFHRASCTLVHLALFPILRLPWQKIAHYFAICPPMLWSKFVKVLNDVEKFFALTIPRRPG